MNKVKPSSLTMVSSLILFFSACGGKATHEFGNKFKISVLKTCSGMECYMQDCENLRKVCAWLQKTSMCLNLGYQNLSILLRKSTQPGSTVLKITTH